MKTALFAALASLSATCACAADYEAKSSAELAKELANPNSPLSSLKFKTQFRAYDGSISGASEQEGTTVLFQPTLPFPMPGDNTLYVRPAVPLLIGQPVFAPPGSSSKFNSESGIGDITIDIQYGDTEENGFLWSYGLTTTLPTASDESLGIDTWALGPGFQLGKVGENYVIGGFVNHQWDVSGSDDEDFSLSTMQVFAVYLPGGGWSVATSPIMSYDHISGTATIPLNITVEKTLMLKGRPWKFGIEFNHYIEKSDEFGPDWMIGINIAPVVKNKIAEWF